MTSLLKTMMLLAMVSLVKAMPPTQSIRTACSPLAGANTEIEVAVQSPKATSHAQDSLIGSSSSGVVPTSQDAVSTSQDAVLVDKNEAGDDSKDGDSSSEGSEDGGSSDLEGNAAVPATPSKKAERRRKKKKLKAARERANKEMADARAADTNDAKAHRFVQFDGSIHQYGIVSAEEQKALLKGAYRGDFGAEVAAQCKQLGAAVKATSLAVKNKRAEKDSTDNEIEKGHKRLGTLLKRKAAIEPDLQKAMLLATELNFFMGVFKEHINGISEMTSVQAAHEVAMRDMRAERDALDEAMRIVRENHSRAKAAMKAAVDAMP